MEEAIKEMMLKIHRRNQATKANYPSWVYEAWVAPMLDDCLKNLPEISKAAPKEPKE